MKYLTIIFTVLIALFIIGCQTVEPESSTEEAELDLEFDELDELEQLESELNEDLGFDEL